MTTLYHSTYLDAGFPIAMDAIQKTQAQVRLDGGSAHSLDYAIFPVRSDGLCGRIYYTDNEGVVRNALIIKEDN